MSKNHWKTVDPSLFIEKKDGSCDKPKFLNTKKLLKYRNNPIHDPDYGFFHSSGENARWHVLLCLEQQGFISELKRQVPYVLCDAEDCRGMKLHKITYILKPLNRNSRISTKPHKPCKPLVHTTRNDRMCL